MRPLVFELGRILTIYVVILCLFAHFFKTSHPPNAVSVSVVYDGLYTLYPKPPRPGTRTPRYQVELFIARHGAICSVPIQPLVSRSPLYHEVPSALRRLYFPPFQDQYRKISLHAYPLAMSHRRQVVGYYGGGASGAWLVILARAFSWRHSRLHLLPTLPNYQITHAVALNNEGEIVGDALIDSFPADMEASAHAVCWIHGKVHDLGTGEATAINDSGIIVGNVGTGPADDSGPGHALLWRHGIRYDLNNCISPRSGWVLAEATGINNKGQIVGNGLLHGIEHGFLLTPITYR